MALIHSSEDFFMKYFNEEVYGKFFKYSKAVFLNLLGFKSRLTEKILYYCPGHNFLVLVKVFLNMFFSTTKC